MFFFIRYSYAPNTAPTNRAMGYLRAFSEMGVQTRVILFEPDRVHSKIQEDYPHIEFEYLWDKCYIGVPRLKKLSLRLYLRKFVRNLKKGDTVYVYGFPDLVVALSKRDDINVFVERTEYDEASFVCHINKVTIPEFHEACRKINGIIVISQPLREYYINNGCQPGHVHVINMIVDSTRFKDLAKQPAEPYIAYCGTASNNKDGVDQLIKSFAIVVKKHPDYKLYIIGSTPSRKQRFGNLDLVRSLGIEKNVVFTGVVPSCEMPQILKDAEILALDRPDNQQAKYGFPTKLGEYLLTGNPVVITRVGDIPLFLNNEESALLSEPDKLESFAEKLCWAIEHSEEAKRIGATGRIVAEQSFNYLIETEKLKTIVGI